jgi:hypothetical protein
VIRWAAVLGSFALLVVPGCGGGGKPSDHDQIEAALTTYYKAFGKGDSAAACNQLAADTREELEKAGGGKDCAEILDQALKRPDYARVAPKLSGVQISAVTIAGDKATARAIVPGVGKPTIVPLKKEGGSWKIASPVGE